jgi:hypothetical protein
MRNHLRFDDLQAILHPCIDYLPDHRQPSPNTRYTIQDAVLSAFGIFFTQSPSFLEYQRRLQHTKGRNNAQTLFGVAQIPCDNQVRTLLDPLAPSHLDPVFMEIFTGLEQHHMLDHFRVLGDGVPGAGVQKTTIRGSIGETVEKNDGLHPHIRWTKTPDFVHA